MKENGRKMKKVVKVFYLSKEIGVMVYNNGERFEGEWQDDKRNGEGLITS